MTKIFYLKRSVLLLIVFFLAKICYAADWSEPLNYFPYPDKCQQLGYTLGGECKFISCPSGWVKYRDVANYTGPALCYFGSVYCCNAEIYCPGDPTCNGTYSYQTLTAREMCCLLKQHELSKCKAYTCDFPNEQASWYCDTLNGNTVALFCVDCQPLKGCDPPYGYIFGPHPTSEYVCAEEGDKYECDSSDTVERGTSDRWGYDWASAASTTTTTTIPGVVSSTTSTTTTVQVPPSPPTDQCSPQGETKCEGLALYRCDYDASYGALNWVLVEDPSPQCCDDGDCSEEVCEANNGAWFPGAPNLDSSLTGYCCGDDGAADLGNILQDKLCVEDSGVYTWVIGEECQRYANNKIVFSDGVFFVCSSENPGEYEELDDKGYCENICNFYCEPQSNTWLNNTNPELNILAEPIGENEKIDTLKTDLTGSYGCCPAAWCWNSSHCIENQADEPDDLYVYDAGIDIFRCIDGEWRPAEMVYTWDFHLRGYCPRAGEQCLVSYESYENNDKPKRYFSDEKPQCIASGQYILDYYCNGSEWRSRTALLATKMLALEKADTEGDFRLFCDDYRFALNDYSYFVESLPVENYLNKSCSINGYPVRCVNNFCVLEDKKTGKVLVGTTSNVNPFGEQGIAPVFNVTGCYYTNPDNPWVYSQCGPFLIYNSNISALIYSNQGVTPAPELSGWELFLELIANPFEAISQLIMTGGLQFYGVSGVELRFDILNTAKLFSRLYIADSDIGEVQAALEPSKFDWRENNTKYYLIAKYSDFSVDVCSYVNNFSVNYGRYNCEMQNGSYIVVDSRQTQSYLMGYWTSLTTTLLP